MEQNIRLIAYRNDTAFPLDIKDAPNISINFKFSDIRDLSKKKSSYSQNFQLPFTDNNNTYFQNWNQVNASPITNGFANEQNNTAILYVNNLEQFKGYLVLKGVYKEKGYYDVMILGKVANLYATVGSKTLTEAFEGVTKYNHSLTAVTIQNSWNNNLGADFNDTVADTCKIVYPIFSASMPMIWNSQNYLNENNENSEYVIEDQESGGATTQIQAPGNRLLLQEQKPAIQLRTVLEQIFISNGYTWTSTFLDSVYFRKLYMTTCNHLDNAISSPPNTSDAGAGMPPVVFGKWGYTEMRGIRSGFTGFTMDAYDKIWQLPQVSTQTYQNLEWDDTLTLNQDFNVSTGNLSVTLGGSLNLLENGCIAIPTAQATGELSVNIKTMVSIVCEENSGDLETPFTPTSESTTVFYADSGAYPCYVGVRFVMVQWSFVGGASIPVICGESEYSIVQCATEVNSPNTEAQQSPGDVVYNNINYSDGINPNGDFKYLNVTFTNDLEPINSEDPIAVYVQLAPMDTGGVVPVQMGSDCTTSNASCDQLTALFGKPGSSIDSVTDGSTTTDCLTTCTITGNTQGGFNPYNQTVEIPRCIDPTITQKDFLKDLTDRFNLSMQTDPDNENNLLIEPTQDFLDAGDSKFWTDKLDMSKEVIVHPTTDLKFNKIDFTDKEDTDFLNKFVAQYFPEDNVLGKYSVDFNTGAYATGKELKNKPIFSPYIVEDVPISTTDGTVDPLAQRILLHRGYSYDENGNITFGATSPKLFYYGGRPVQLPGNPATPDSGTNYNIWIYWGQSDGDGLVDWNKAVFNEYPLCSAYEVNRDLTTDFGTTLINPQTRALRWGPSYIFGGQSPVFAYSDMLQNGFYEKYWREYLGQIYHEDARLMVCYLKLNEVDISNFNFNDKIFIKNAYWRILEITNYQAGTNASVKVKLLKLIDTQAEIDANCQYFYTGNNYYLGPFVFPIWAPVDDPTNVSIALTDPSCCSNLGLTAIETETPGYYLCLD